MLKNSFKFNKLVYLYFSLFQQLVEVRNQTVFFLQTAELWSTSCTTDVCRYGPQTTDVLSLKKQTTPKTYTTLPVLLNYNLSNSQII
ncbi:hypothetical protein Hanom_Chr10g00945171 [Helianthus anomalus]